MSKLKIKKREHKCTACGAEGGILLVTMPRNLYLRPRTESESAAYEQLVKDFSEGLVDSTALMEFHRKDKKARTIRLCKEHLKPYWKQQGTTNVNKFRP